MQVEFLLLGIIKGSVGLRGYFEEVTGASDTVKVISHNPIPRDYMQTLQYSDMVHCGRRCLGSISLAYHLLVLFRLFL